MSTSINGSTTTTTNVSSTSSSLSPDNNISTTASSNAALIDPALTQSTTSTPSNPTAPLLTPPTVSAKDQEAAALLQSWSVSSNSSEKRFSQLIANLKEKNPGYPQEVYDALLTAINSNDVIAKLKSVLEAEGLLKSERHLITQELYELVQSALAEENAAISALTANLDASKSLQDQAEVQQKKADAEHAKLAQLDKDDPLYAAAKQTADNYQKIADQFKQSADASWNKVLTQLTTVTLALQKTSAALAEVAKAPLDTAPITPPTPLQTSMDNLLADHLDQLGKLMLLLSTHADLLDKSSRATMQVDAFTSQKLREGLLNVIKVANDAFQRSLNVMRTISLVISWVFTAMLGLGAVILRLLGIVDIAKELKKFVKGLFRATLKPLLKIINKFIKKIFASLTTLLAKQFENLGVDPKLAKFLGSLVVVAGIALVLAAVALAMPGIGTTVAIGTGLFLLMNRNAVLRPLIKNFGAVLGDTLKRLGVDDKTAKKIGDIVVNALYVLVTVVTAIIPQMHGKDKMFQSAVNFFGKMASKVLQQWGVKQSDAKLAGKLAVGLGIAAAIVVETIILAIAITAATEGAAAGVAAAEISESIASTLQALQNALTALSTILSTLTGLTSSAQQVGQGITSSASYKVQGSLTFYSTLLREMQQWVNESIVAFGDAQTLKQEATSSISDVVDKGSRAVSSLQSRLVA